MYIDSDGIAHHYGYEEGTKKTVLISTAGLPNMKGNFDGLLFAMPYFTTNTFSLRVAHYKANPKASIYYCDVKGFKGMMLRGTMEVLTDAKSKEMIWREGDEQYYPAGVTDPNYCVLKFTATDGRFYSDFYPRSFVL